VKAAFSGATTVPFARVVREHRAWLVPLVAVLLVTIGILTAGVLPYTRRVATSERRADTARQSLAAAEREFEAAETLRTSQAAAGRDLRTFYEEVLPKGFAAARRVTHLRLAEMAEAHGVRYERRSASPQTQRGSALERLNVTLDLSGDYDDIRAFLHDLETSQDFIVIDNLALSENQSEQSLSLTLQLSTYYLVGPHGG
jgi:Tfp pilus assembly protein PilO